MDKDSKKLLKKLLKNVPDTYPDFELDVETDCEENDKISSERFLLAADTMIFRDTAKSCVP